MNTDSKVTLHLNYEIHSKNCQISNMELCLGKNKRLKSASLYCKKLPLKCLTRIQIRKNR